MAIKIQTQQTGIPVELGELKFTFDVSDESIKKFRENAKKIQKELAEIGEITDEKMAEAKAKDALRKGFDLTLGAGAFEKIYEQTPSTMIVLQYFIQVSEGINEELEKLTSVNSQQAKVDRYLNNKKKQNRQKSRKR